MSSSLQGVGEADAGSHVRKIRWETLELTKGTYKMADCDANNIANIMFDKPVPLKVQFYCSFQLVHFVMCMIGERGLTAILELVSIHSPRDFYFLRLG